MNLAWNSRKGCWNLPASETKPTSPSQLGRRKTQPHEGRAGGGVDGDVRSSRRAVREDENQAE